MSSPSLSVIASAAPVSLAQPAAASPAAIELPGVAANLRTEIICMIFDYAVASELRPHKGIQRLPPWHLGHICRRWRSIAISTPLLWSTIVNTGRRQDCFWVPIMLERAAGAPLDVLVDMWGESVQTVREALELLLPHSSTFRSVLSTFDYFEDYDGDEECLLMLVSRFLPQMTDIVEMRVR